MVVVWSLNASLSGESEDDVLIFPKIVLFFHETLNFPFLRWKIYARDTLKARDISSPLVGERERERKKENERKKR